MKNQQDIFWEDMDAASTHTSQAAPAVAAAAWFQGFHRLLNLLRSTCRQNNQLSNN